MHFCGVVWLSLHRCKATLSSLAYWNAIKPSNWGSSLNCLMTIIRERVLNTSYMINGENKSATKQQTHNNWSTDQKKPCTDTLWLWPLFTKNLWAMFNTLDSHNENIVMYFFPSQEEIESTKCLLKFIFSSLDWMREKFLFFFRTFYARSICGLQREIQQRDNEKCF